MKLGVNLRIFLYVCMHYQLNRKTSETSLL